MRVGKHSSTGKRNGTARPPKTQAPHPAAAKLAVARAQQAATAEVLRAVRESTADLRRVLDMLVRRAAELCGARDASIFGIEGTHMRRLALCGLRLTAFRLGETRPITRGTVSGRAILERRTVSVRDLRASARTQFPGLVRTARRDRVRTVVTVPLLRGRGALGAITVYRREVQPFTREQLALLRTFADQAVIAIENARLFNETKEALEQQKASTEILKIITPST